MTKAEAVSMFKETRSNWKLWDRVMRREAWSDYTDALCKDGVITPTQYDNWHNPF